jgi:hypothetical protein
MKQNFLDFLGFSGEPITDDGNVAMIATPFVFEDGDELPVYVENVADRVCFFDGGGVIFHLYGRGMLRDEPQAINFLKAIASKYDVVLNDKGELAVSSSVEDAPSAFTRYLLTVLEVVQWEHMQVAEVTA